MNVLVVGATGLLGSEICRQLTENDHRVHALVRQSSSPEKTDALQKEGCHLLTGDLKDPASLAKACQGKDAVISTASSTFSRQDGDSIQSVDRDGQLALVDAAKEAGVKKFVFISFPDMSEFQNSLNQAKRAVEHRLSESGMDFTSLQANLFMEVWLSPALGFDFPNHAARIYGTGEPKHGWVSFRDVARFAVSSLQLPYASNKTISIGGPTNLSPLEVIGIFEQQSGQNFQVEKVPEEALRAQNAQAATPLDKAFTSLMLSYAKGMPMEMKETSQAFAFPLTSVSDYAKAVLMPQS